MAGTQPSGTTTDSNCLNGGLGDSKDREPICDSANSNGRNAIGSGDLQQPLIIVNGSSAPNELPNADTTFLPSTFVVDSSVQPHL